MFIIIIVTEIYNPNISGNMEMLFKMLWHRHTMGYRETIERKSKIYSTDTSAHVRKSVSEKSKDGCLYSVI